MTDGTGLRVRSMRFNLAQLAREDDSVKAAEVSIARATRALDEAREHYKTVVYATAYFKQIAALGGNAFVDAVAKQVILNEVNHGGLNVDAIKADEPRPAYVRSNLLDPKTLNTLLTGKLLTPEEKRALLKSQGVDLDAIAATPNT